MLETAKRLFYAHGSGSVGVDRIILESGVSKATFYRHFPSKDDLIVAVLDAMHVEAMASMPSTAEALAARTGENPVLCLFDVLRRWFSSATFNGCAFVRTALERPADEAVRLKAATHKQAIQSWIVATLKREGRGPGAEETARAIMLLYDGAIVHARIGKSPEAADIAKIAAANLIANALPPPPVAKRKSARRNSS